MGFPGSLIRGIGSTVSSVVRSPLAGFAAGFIPGIGPLVAGAVSGFTRNGGNPVTGGAATPPIQYNSAAFGNQTFNNPAANPNSLLGVGGIAINSPYGNWSAEAGNRGSVIIPGWMYIVGPLVGIGIITRGLSKR